MNASVGTRQLSAAVAAEDTGAFAEVLRTETSESNSSIETSVCFGPFEFFPRRRCLFKAGQRVQLGGKSIDLLTVLAERRGEVVDKNELFSRVWRGIVVDSGALRFQVAALRKALGEDMGDDGHIKTVSGRGYCLIAARDRPRSLEQSAAAAEIGSPPQLPAPVEGMIGRDEAVRRISDLLKTNRLVTVHGPAGVGKTTVAVAVAHAEASSFAGDVHFIDLGPVASAHRLPDAIASVFGLPDQSIDPLPALLNHLEDRHALLVFDCCDHLIEPVSLIIERILHRAPQVSILATSRDMLSVDGEHVYRLSGLACPPDEAGDRSAERILSFDAPRLFANHVVANGYEIEITEADALLAADICRKLDGLALAIKIAAARVPSFGFPQVASSLESGSWLRWRGQRTALPRHQTMAAAIDWSYDLLCEEERAAMRRLSLCRGLLSLDEICDALSGTLPSRSDALQIVGMLVTKSLISFETAEGGGRYRMPNLIRSYALEKLQSPRSITITA
ncbi:winged helix-turn-helix domain-containing protein [Bradyrhizobium sp. BR 10289]|uniref:ATP-binding protein n=1 Tax=Bradyrhizobium sp. BR 10289 TaxID=2749993 RepID=UPI001C649B8A|nr:winged helix-turn-helix domain-containing protein [Bradyrhizobium sp. BR 10289]MBW7974089.1 winged helix-turn-helix domain-containing protein [Bradyrhizobium sp. BR 10289]